MESGWKQVEDWVNAGIKVYSCYEAGARGYWYHRELTKVGAVNFVVVPRQLEDQRTRRQRLIGLMPGDCWIGSRSIWAAIAMR